MDKIVLLYLVKGHYCQNVGILSHSRSTVHIFFRPPLSILPLSPGGGGGVRKGCFSRQAPSIHGTLFEFRTPRLILLTILYPFRNRFPLAHFTMSLLYHSPPAMLPSRYLINYFLDKNNRSTFNSPSRVTI